MSPRRKVRLPAGRRPHIPAPLVMVLVSDPVIRVATATLFREHGYSVREVTSLDDAIHRVELEPPDAILLDVTRDWRRARLAARTFRILRITYDVPLIAMAAAPAPEAEREGFDAVLTAPFSGGALLELVRRQIEQRNRLGGAA